MPDAVDVDAEFLRRVHGDVEVDGLAGRGGTGRREPFDLPAHVVGGAGARRGAGAGTRAWVPLAAASDSGGPGSTYQGTTWPVSSKYVTLPRSQGTGPWPKGSVTAWASAPDSQRRMWCSGLMSGPSSSP